MDFTSLNQHLGTFRMMLPYTVLTFEDFTGTTSLCTAIDGRKTGISGGNVACYLDIPVSSAYIISKVRIIFSTIGQYKEILPYCEAYISSGPSTVTGGQLACSLSDATSGQISLIISGFTFVTGSRIRVLFRIRLLSTPVKTNIVLQGEQNGNIYTLHRQLNYNIDATTASSGSCILIMLQMYLNFA